MDPPHDSAEPARTLPLVDDENRTFWTGGADGLLRIRRCGACGFYIHPPSPRCPKCLSTDVHDAVVSGRGTVASFTINHQRWLPALRVPYVIALIELEEQSSIRLVTNIVNCAPEAVCIGMQARVVFEKYDEVYLPMFELASAI